MFNAHSEKVLEANMESNVDSPGARRLGAGRGMECVERVSDAYMCRGRSTWTWPSPMSTLNQPLSTPDPSRPRLRDVRKKFQSSTSAIANSGKGAEHTWLSYPVEEVSEYLVKDELKGERRVAGRGRWCVREPSGGDSTRSGVGWMGGNGPEARGLQLCQMDW